MTNAVKKSEVEITSFPTRRFNLPDMNDMGVWITGRLRERYAHLNDKNIFGWLRGLSASSEDLFIRTDHAVLMAQIVHETISPAPIVYERFVLVNGPEHDAEALSLYDDLYRWAQSLGAKEIVVGEFSDVKRPQIMSRLGQGMVKERLVIRVTK